MYVSNCLKHPKMITSQCTSEKSGENQCICMKASRISNMKYKDIDMKLIYKDLKIEDTVDRSDKDEWSPFNKMRVRNCLDSGQEASWKCITYNHKKDNTICSCHHSFNLISIGTVNSHDLYKNLDNFTFVNKPSIIEQNIAKNRFSNIIFANQTAEPRKEVDFSHFNDIEKKQILGSFDSSILYSNAQDEMLYLEKNILLFSSICIFVLVFYLFAFDKIKDVVKMNKYKRMQKWREKHTESFVKDIGFNYIY